MFERMQERNKRDKQTTNTGGRKKSVLIAAREAREEEEAVDAARERAESFQAMATSRAARRLARQGSQAALESASPSAVESSEELNARLDRQFAPASSVAVAASNSTAPEEGEVNEGGAEEGAVAAEASVAPVVGNEVTTPAVVAVALGAAPVASDAAGIIAASAPNPVAPVAAPVAAPVRAVVDENVADVDVDESGIQVREDRILQHHLDKFLKNKTIQDSKERNQSSHCCVTMKMMRRTTFFNGLVPDKVMGSGLMSKRGVKSGAPSQITVVMQGKWQNIIQERKLSCGLEPVDLKQANVS